MTGTATAYSSCRMCKEYACALQVMQIKPTTTMLHTSLCRHLSDDTTARAALMMHNIRPTSMCCKEGWQPGVAQVEAGSNPWGSNSGIQTTDCNQHAASRCQMMLQLDNPLRNLNTK